MIDARKLDKLVSLAVTHGANQGANHRADEGLSRGRRSTQTILSAKLSCMEATVHATAQLITATNVKIGH